MPGIPSNRMFTERPPSAEETFRRLIAQSAKAVAPSPATTSTAEVSKRSLARATAPEAADAVPVSISVAPQAPPQTPTASQVEFREIYSTPENQIFKVVFFPDRIFHAQYLNASRAPERYRYAVSDARSVLDLSVLKAQVFMDGQKAANLVRIEYRGSRLIEMTRESGRFLREEIIAWVRLNGKAYLRDESGSILAEDGGLYDPNLPESKPLLEDRSVDQPVKMHFCPWINAYQVEIWTTLEPPAVESHHHFQVLAQMGPTGSITRVRSFSPVLEVINHLQSVEMAFRENDVDIPSGKPITDPKWDNAYERNYQSPRSPFPNDNQNNTVPVGNYSVNFQKGWFLNANDVAPVRYRNAMMDDRNPERVPPENFPQWNAVDAWKGNVPAQAFTEANVLEMRWILQRELGGSMVFFHEVTIPPGVTEGTHCHVGSEEMYYIVAGEGVAYMAEGDDPETSKNDPETGHPKYRIVERAIFGLEPHKCVELPVKPGCVIFTKSGGIHGIKNTGDVPLKFVAFLYHSV